MPTAFRDLPHLVPLLLLLFLLYQDQCNAQWWDMDSDEKKKNIFCNLKDFIRLIQKYFEGQIKKENILKVPRIA